MGIPSVLPENNLSYASLPPGDLNAEKISSAPTDVLKSWISDGNLSAQEKQAVLEELVHRANEAKSSSTEPEKGGEKGGEEGSLESLLLKLSDGTITDDETTKLAQGLGMDPKDLDKLAPPGSTAPSEGDIH